MKITIGIPFHNNTPALKWCLSALDDALEMAQVQSASIILVNDYSNLDQETEVETWVRKDKRMRMLDTRLRTDQPNPNVGLAINMILSCVRIDDDYVLLLDSDAYMSHTTLVDLLDALDMNNKACAAMPALKSLDDLYDMRFWGMGKQPKLGADFMKPCFCNAGSTSCLLMHGEYARDPRLLVDERFRLWHLDYELTFKLTRLSGKSVLWWPDAECLHQGSVTAQEGSGQYDTIAESSRLLLERFWGPELDKPLFR